ncbi:MAG: hypothetical protein PUP46_01195 [Endozoicomonas sp. (ex Botrylloides leachii)]|nr:hypothetical protein [Endozoicomonas sp. (ex Botrylloides leachii)]
MKLKSGVFYFFISLLLTFSYSTYGDEDYKNIFLFDLENRSSEELQKIPKYHLIFKIEEKLYSVPNVRFRLYTQTEKYGGMRIVRIDGRYKSDLLYQNADRVKGIPLLHDMLHFGSIKDEKHLNEEIEALLKRLFSKTDIKRLQ